MKATSRIAVSGVVLLLALTPLGARADHCTEVRLLSGQFLLVHTGAVGCAGGLDADTDYINPGSTTLLIRVFGAERPSDASSITFAPIQAVGGLSPCEPGRCQLATWTYGEDAIGEPPGPYWDSQSIGIQSRPGSITGGEAVIEICFESAHCETRTYRTIASV